MTTDSIWDLLDRYFSDACSPEEAERVARRLAVDPAWAEQVRRARMVWNASRPADGVSGSSADRLDTRVAWRNVQPRLAPAYPRAHLDSEGGTSRESERPVLHVFPGRTASRAPRWRTMVFGLAAAGIVAVIGGVLWHRGGGWPFHAPHAAPRGPMHEYAAARGQRAAIVLTDGTQVMLNVDSHLRVPANYGAGSRDVFLDGEAFFTVAHHAVPFRVHAGGAIAEDLGTAFLVRAYPEDSGATVVVSQGSVSLRATDGRGDASANRSVALHARQLGRVNASPFVHVVSNVDVQRYLAWQHAELRFDHTPLASVLRTLGRWYDIQVTVSDAALDSVPVTGVYVNSSLHGILDDIAESLDVRYTQQGSRIELEPNTPTR